MKLGLELRMVAGRRVGGIPQSVLKQIVQGSPSPVEMVFIDPGGTELPDQCIILSVHSPQAVAVLLLCHIDEDEESSSAEEEEDEPVECVFHGAVVCTISIDTFAM